MKGIDIFCASQAATAISRSMEQGSSSSSSSNILLGGGRAIDRHNPIITDSRRNPKSLPPCTTTTPKPHHKKKKKVPFKENEELPEKYGEKKGNSDGTSINDGNGGDSAKTGDLIITPPGSTRFLLRDKVWLGALSDYSDPPEKLSPDEIFRFEDEKTEELFHETPPSSSPIREQVVVLKVSLHCRGCERKLRKHLSKMEGVTSFNIEFAAKKVTVTGKVTPVGVLSSISKVKNAQLWSPEISSSSSIPPLSDNLSQSESSMKEAGA